MPRMGPPLGVVVDRFTARQKSLYYIVLLSAYFFLLLPAYLCALAFQHLVLQSDFHWFLTALTSLSFLSLIRLFYYRCISLLFLAKHGVDPLRSLEYIDYLRNSNGEETLEALRLGILK